MKKVIGIISVVMFMFITLQSCVATIVDIDGGMSGLMLSFLMLMAGIITLMSKWSQGMTITATAMYALGGLIGMTGAGLYADLQLWSILSFVFSGMLIYHLISKRDMYKKHKNLKEEL